MQSKRVEESKVNTIPPSIRASVPDSYICPISLMIMREPVIASDGEHYEKEFIEAHLKKHDHSPKQGGQIKLEKMLYRDISLKETIDNFLLQHPELFYPVESDKHADVYIPSSYWQKLIDAVHADNTSQFKDIVKLDPRLLMLIPRQSETLDKEKFPNISIVQLATNNYAHKVLNAIFEITHGKLGALLSEENKEWDVIKKTHLALGKGDLQTLKTLYQAGQNREIFKAFCDGKFNPLLYLLASGYVTTAEFLLEEKLVDLKDASQPSYPITQAIMTKDNVSALNLLNKHGFSILETNLQGTTTLHAAVKYRAIRAVTYLLENKANVNARDNEGRTPLYHIYSNCYQQMELQLAALLLQHQANPNIASHAGVTPLHMVENVQTAELLINNKAEVDAKDSAGDTPLNYAVKKYDHQDKVKLLLKHKANPNGGNPHFDRSALIEVIRWGRNEMSLALINAGANIHVVMSDNGKCDTLLGIWPAKSNDKLVCQALLARGCNKWTGALGDEAYITYGYGQLARLSLPITKINSEEAMQIAKYAFEKEQKINSQTFFAPSKETQQPMEQKKEAEAQRKSTTTSRLCLIM